MIELQQYIRSVLVPIHPRVYLEQAPQEAVYPYVVYQLPSSSMGADHREDFTLEVDVWDRPADGSTVPMQLIADEMDRALNGLIYVSPDGWSARFYRIGRLMIPDPDPAIRRRQLRYEIRTYQGG